MRPDAQQTAARVLRTLASHRFRFSTELELQQGSELALTEEGIEFEREARLHGAGRIDFLVGGVGLEVKVGSAPAAVLRQLQRYARRPQVEHLVLATTERGHGFQGCLRGVPVDVVLVDRGAL